MPIEELTIPEMFELSYKREEAEALLAKRIYEVFNQGLALKNLQQLTGHILNAIARGPIGALNEAIKEEPLLRLWNKINKGQQYIEMWASMPSLLEKLDATDVGDVMRLAGAWVEKGGGGTVMETQKEAIRTGNLGSQKDAVWKQPKGPAAAGMLVKPPSMPQLATQRVARFRADGWKLEPQLLANTRDKKTFSGMGGDPNRHSGGSKRLVSGTNLSIIDRLFGLTWGCDISGTTCDEVYTLRKFGGMLNKAYQLLPLGPIVHNNHHTILECALPLSFNDIIDYRVGFYHTLIPTEGLPEELSGIRAAVDAMDASMRENHIFRYYQESRPKGALRFTGNHLNLLKQNEISRARHILDLVIQRRISTYPTKTEIQQFLNTIPPA